MTGYRESNKEDSIESAFQFEDLEEKGRLQYFFHSSSSKLPIRDVLKNHKTEPHIEIGAENYISTCYQSNNIIPFLESKGKYLFLFTTCKDQDHMYYNKKCIVGFISKKKHIPVTIKNRNKSHYSVLGDTNLYSFNDCLPISHLGYKEGIRVKKVNEKDTKIILKHFRGKKNIIYECIKEIKHLDKNNYTCKKDSKNFECKFKNQCLRWKIL